MIGLIVDGYSSGTVLANELRKKGCSLYHVQSRRDVPKPYQHAFDPAIYVKNKVIESEGSIPPGIFDGVKFDFVVAGSEPGVILADKLSSHFGVMGNCPVTSEQRRNKAKMMMRLRECGLQAVEEMVVSTGMPTPPVPTSWFPVVVKPVASGGSEDVQICENQSDVEHAVTHTLSKSNIFGFDNIGVVIQRKLEGEQYMINAVSKNGRHKIIEIWQERRLHTQDGHSVYDREILMPSDFENSQQIDVYVKAVLSALGVKFGPSHTELFLTSKGPVLLESAARMQGGIDGAAIESALGYSHISCVRELLLNPETFETHIQETYQPPSNIMLVNFISNRAGIVAKNNVAETVALFPSFHSTKGVPEPGQRIQKTVDLFSKPGHVYLVHDSMKQLEEDYLKIRAYEKAEAIFTIEGE